jgi:hypothetical protein
MESDSKVQKLLFFIGILFIGVGLILNEFLLTALFSEDGVLASSSRFKIWLFNGFCVGSGLLLVLSEQFRMFVVSAYPVVNRMRIIKIKDLMDNFTFFIRSVLIALVVLLLFMQMSYMVSAIHENQDNHGIIYSIDADAGDNIYHTLRTGLFSGGYLNHGVLYQRIAHYLAWLSPVFTSYDTDDEKTEKKTHFSLVVISLFSMYCISFLLASIVCDETLYKLVGTLLMSAAILSEGMWANYVLRVHPDLLLSFLSALFLFLIYKSGMKSNSKYYYLACLVAGACLSTKPIFFLFLPGLIFIEIPPVNIGGIKKLIRLYLLIAISYFVLAIPFTLRVFTLIKSLMGVRSGMSTAPTWESLIQWWNILIVQGWKPLVILIILSLVSGKNLSEDHQRDKYFYLRLWAVAFIPFILLIFHNSEFGHGHWTLPFVSILLLAVAVSLLSLRLGLVVRIRSWFSRDLARLVTVILLIFGVEVTLGIIPNKVDQVLNRQIRGREEVRTTYQVINSYADNGNKVLVEAYVPFRHGHEKIIHGGHLTVTLDNFKNYDPDVVTVNAYQMPHIMEGEKPSDYMIIGRENYQEIRQYYGLFYNKRKTVDPWGRKWVKTYQDSMGVQIWQKG